MEIAEKKRRRSPGRGRLLPVLLAAAVCAGLLLLQQMLSQPPVDIPDAPVSTALTLFSYEEQAVQSLSVTHRSGDVWQAVSDEEGRLVLSGEDGFVLSDQTAAALRDAAHIITAEALLSEDPAEYTPYLADYGLTDPWLRAEIRYADGTQAGLTIGDAPPHDGAWRYMLVDGDDRLFAISKGLADLLAVERASLHEVVQPVIHKARIDRITLRSAAGTIQAEWALQGSITDADALERWVITQPIQYPADANAMSGLLANAANLRLGSYVGPASEALLSSCGFDTPRLTIELHMAPGTIGTTDAAGAFVPQDWEESSCTFTIGGAKNDVVDYVLYEDAVYLSSHFTMGVFLEADPADTMSRYLLPTALGNLQRLTIEQDGCTDVYVITRTEQVAPNNDLVYDENGHIVYDLSCTRNGAPFDYAAFEAAYSRLTTVMVSGVLPAGETLYEAPHTCYTFTDLDGTVHTVTLASFDALHDAVIVDGHAAFYLIKGGFALDL